MSGLSACSFPSSIKSVVSLLVNVPKSASSLSLACGAATERTNRRIDTIPRALKSMSLLSVGHAESYTCAWPIAAPTETRPIDKTVVQQKMAKRSAIFAPCRLAISHAPVHANEPNRQPAANAGADTKTESQLSDNVKAIDVCNDAATMIPKLIIEKNILVDLFISILSTSYL